MYFTSSAGRHESEYIANQLVQALMYCTSSAESGKGVHCKPVCTRRQCTPHHQQGVGRGCIPDHLVQVPTGRGKGMHCRPTCTGAKVLHIISREWEGGYIEDQLVQAPRYSTSSAGRHESECIADQFAQASVYSTSGVDQHDDRMPCWRSYVFAAEARKAESACEVAR